MKSFFFLLTIVVSCFPLAAQTKKYFIEFTDKTNTPYSLGEPQKFLSARAIKRRENQKINLTINDLPVNPTYIQAVRQAGAKVWYTSRWMNGALIEADEVSLIKVKKLAFVQSSSIGDRPITQTVGTGQGGKRLSARTTAIDYGSSLMQNQLLGIPAMHDAGFTGKTMHIAIIDGGFQSVNQIPMFKPLFDSQRLLGTYDFVDNETNVYDNKGTHGTPVLSTLAGYLPGKLVGAAYHASYWLLRSENEEDDYEYRIEEVNWLMAAEFADSVGVDIINTSLGYNTFEDASMNYTPEQMDGKTAFITRAASMASATGMLVVVSAGNTGNDEDWQTLTAPADAEEVLTVASVYADGEKSSFSAFGKLINGTIKPTIAALGSGVVVSDGGTDIKTTSGTSFAAPLAAGLAAGLWQAYPMLTNKQLIDYLKRAGTQASKPDMLLGYGIPNFTRANALLMQDGRISFDLAYLYPNPATTESITLRMNKNMLTEPVELQFFDMRGATVYSYGIAIPNEVNEVVLPPAVFTPGLYVIKCSNSQQQVLLRLIKQ